MRTSRSVGADPHRVDGWTMVVLRDEAAANGLEVLVTAGTLLGCIGLVDEDEPVGLGVRHRPPFPKAQGEALTESSDRGAGAQSRMVDENVAAPYATHVSRGGGCRRPRRVFRPGGRRRRLAPPPAMLPACRGGRRRRGRGAGRAAVRIQKTLDAEIESLVPHDTP